MNPDSILFLEFLSRVSISQKGIVKCDVFGPIYISYVRCRDEHQAVGIVKHYELNLSLF